ncbi:MAG: hypothetical protein SFX72_09615 [Isosphaeraceae bacterium]|nr:hypothetical protein [Isosphaeraceae bacterium]
MKLSKMKILLGVAGLVLTVAVLYFIQNLSALNLSILVSVASVGGCGYMLAWYQQYESRLAEKDRIIEQLESDKEKLKQFVAEQVLKETRVESSVNVVLPSLTTYAPRESSSKTRFPWQLRFDRRAREISVTEKPAIDQGEVG